jgi:hypothetical protein
MSPSLEEKMHIKSVDKMSCELCACTDELVLACWAFLLITAFLPHILYAQDTTHSIPACNNTSMTGASISSVGAPTPLTLRPMVRDGRTVAVGHIYTRNDSGFPLSNGVLEGIFSIMWIDRGKSG